MGRLTICMTCSKSRICVCMTKWMTNHELVRRCILPPPISSTSTRVPLLHLHTTFEGLKDLFRALPPICPHLRTCQWKFGSVSFTMLSVQPIPYPTQNFHGYMDFNPTLVFAQPLNNGSINCNRSLL